MTDITELAQSLKAAADSVIKNYAIEWFEAGHQICTVHKSKINLISLANPANILALVEALEKAQQRNSILERDFNMCQERLISWQDSGIHSANRVKELESRTVTVKLPEVERPIDGTGYAKAAGAQHYKERVIKALTAQGIKWEAE
ncbi:TPA: hypothetical protein QFV80_003300 [Klebsiella aerogenes]|nr:hypothetical protein [Klebsiella aerogenes]